ncbi:3-deoxy-D-manno-octulosonic acid transferase [Symmachiella dynata]|uniref:3-deoxy-D-manno-octulosonic acid transferase n=1 Tax=Symmachiella dynata TaxID=2527995 RepID=UPI0030ED4C08
MPGWLLNHLKSWSLNLTYLTMLVIISPIVLWRMLTQGKYCVGWNERLLGCVPQPKDNKPCLWLHAVSVGEVMQLRPVVAALRSQHPDYHFVITTTTVTGRDVADKSFPDDTVCYFPFDFTWSVRRAFRRLRPVGVVLVELEIWPNLILETDRINVPVILINGRLSANSFRGYTRFRYLVRGLLESVHTFAIQNEIYAQRMRALGAPPERVHVTGSIKFDAVETDRRNPQTTEIRRAFAIADDAPVFIAGSTQSPEEDYALAAYREIRKSVPQLRLILVPRHKERFEEVARLVQSQGFALTRRSTVTSGDSTDGDSANGPPVLLLDTLGELSACWGLADIAFVGGSLTKRGGQNMIEPAGYGAAVLFGPNTRNFRDVVEILLKNDAAVVVHNAEELTTRVQALLQSRSTRLEMGRRAQQLVLAQQGATARTVALISQVLPKTASCEAQSGKRAA